ncbi:MAG: hypothetical protein DI551_03950 [Micavibrio aeruginosavorus]|uniref:Uncharacterized protein n=1 Tax=Micavibrio aeruginosavorus TaxID=349221 RepID=A0A2W5N1X9_9BACT|nr:MAG: hypothetical protein DI551_03950 [Micavibrio aeruginosavorus]
MANLFDVHSKKVDSGLRASIDFTLGVYIRHERQEPRASFAFDAFEFSKDAKEIQVHADDYIQRAEKTGRRIPADILAIPENDRHNWDVCFSAEVLEGDDPFFWLKEYKEHISGVWVVKELRSSFVDAGIPKKDAAQMANILVSKASFKRTQELALN